MTENLPSTYVQYIKPEYQFLPDDVFVPITRAAVPNLPVEIEGRFGINKRCEFKNFVTGNIINPYMDKSTYMIISFRYRKDKSPIKYRTHRLNAQVFIYNPNPKIYSIVNHINCIKNDNRLSNLEWVTPKENSSAERTIKRNYKCLKEYIGIDVTTNIELYRFTSKNIQETFSMSEIMKSIKLNIPYKGCIWKSIRTDIPEFTGNLENYVWLPHWKYPGYYVCKEGFIKGPNGINYSCDEIGTRGYVDVSLGANNHQYAHRIIGEFLEGRELERYEFVDHINGIRNDNRFENLRIVTPKENSNNKNTIKKISNEVCVIDLFGNLRFRGLTRDAYKFIYDTEEYNNLNDSGTVLKSNLTNGKYITFKVGNLITMFSKMEKTIVIKLNMERNRIISVYRSFQEASELTKINSRDIILSAKSRKMAYDWSYYRYGKEAVKYLIDLGYLNNIININTTDENKDTIKNFISTEYSINKFGPEEEFCFNRRVVQLTTYFVYVKTWNSVIESTNSIKTRLNSIYSIYESCLNKGESIVGRYRWVFEDDWINEINPKNKKN